MQNDELNALHEKYYLENGDNMALDLVMKTKRRYKPTIEAPPIKKLTLMSFDLANNDISFTKDNVELF